MFMDFFASKNGGGRLLGSTHILWTMGMCVHMYGTVCVCGVCYIIITVYFTLGNHID